jgi:hypothetical protein
MIPNALLRRWRSAEVAECRRLEQQFVVDMEGQQRALIAVRETYVANELRALLAEYLVRCAVRDSRSAEIEATRKRLEKRAYITQLREELALLDARVRNGHDHLTQLLERSTELKHQRHETFVAEQSRWSEEKKWIEEQYKRLCELNSKPPLSRNSKDQHPWESTGSSVPREYIVGAEALQPHAPSVDLGDDDLLALTSRTNEVLSRARQALAQHS